MVVGISIVLASYNGEKYLKDQLDSIFGQLPADAEVLISDDGSTDRTLEIINAYNHSQVRVLRDGQKRGVIKNFGNALKFATGEIIFLCDQDDIWLPNKIQTKLKYLEQYDMVVSDCTVVSENLEVIIPSWFQVQKSRKGVIKNLMSSSYMGSCMAFKRSVLKIALPFPNDIPMHDMWLGFISELYFKRIFLNERLILYRRHSANASTTSSDSPFNLIEKIKFRINVVKYIPLLIWRKIQVD